MRGLKLVVVIMLAGAWVQAAAQPASLYIATEASPPTSMLDGNRVIGSATDKVREALNRAGIVHTIELLPWKRAYNAALQRSDACVYSTTRTPERENLFKWVGPTDEGEWVFLARADRKLSLQTLEDARSLRIGTYNGDARDEYLRARGFLVDPAPSEMINQKKLMLNRIDLWAASIRRGSSVLVANGWSDKIVPVLTFNRIKVYLACNPAVPDATIDKLNAALDAMQRDGTTRKLEHKYDNWTERKSGPAQ